MREEEAREHRNTLRGVPRASDVGARALAALHRGVFPAPARRQLTGGFPKPPGCRGSRSARMRRSRLRLRCNPKETPSVNRDEASIPIKGTGQERKFRKSENRPRPPLTSDAAGARRQSHRARRHGEQRGLVHPLNGCAPNSLLASGFETSGLKRRRCGDTAAVDAAAMSRCPCCRGRMRIIETLAGGETPHHRPTAMRINTS